MARQRRRKKSTRRVARKRSWSVSRLLWRVLLYGTLGLAVYTVYLDFEIRSRFEGRRWAVPARVYARPLDLYRDAPLDKQSLIDELRRLGYRKVNWINGPGQYRTTRKGDALSLHSRSFFFWNSWQAPRKLRVSFDDGTISGMRDLGRNRELDLFHLEPQLIGSIYPAHNEDRILLRLKDVPAFLVQGLLAVEDRGFYEHYGVAPRAIARALWANIRAGGTVQGGSTLTQQLVKNYFLSSKRSLARKANEAIMALLLELHYDKQEILEAYLNEIFLAQQGRRAIHGVGLASRYFFSKPAAELELEQAALLVAIIKGPSYYDPLRHPKRALKRRNLVLDLMRGQGVITADQAKRAKARGLGLNARGGGSSSYPAYVDLVRRQLRRDYREEDLTSEGLRIFTSFDPILQARAEAALSDGIRRLEKKSRLQKGSLQGALVLTDTQSGEVLAVVGGRNPRYAGFNRALDAVRQIGSLVKPAVMLSALSEPERYNLLTPLKDAPFSTTIADGYRWSPKNYDKKYRGTVSLRDSLIHSYNVPTVRLGLDIGVYKVKDTLRDLGITRPLHNYPSLFLGTVRISPLEVTQMYQTLASGGFYTPLRAIREVAAHEGNALQRYPLTVKQVVDPGAVYLVNHTLREVVSSGTARGVGQFIAPALSVAGKTGTTDDLRDSWFAGFSGNYLAVVWLGTDDNSAMGLSGASGALPVWADLMSRLALLPLADSPPANVEKPWIDLESGLRGAPDCEQAVELPFIRGSAPERYAACAGGRAKEAWEKVKSLFD